MNAVISPHIDDAFLYLGGSIINWRNKKQKVTIIDVFSVSSWINNNPISNKKYPADAEYVTAIRKKEEEKISLKVNVEVIFLDFVCASVSGVKNPAESEKELIEKLLNSEILSKNDKIFVPANLGGHIDHAICKNAGIHLLKGGFNIYFYEDFPLLDYTKINHYVINNLKKDFSPVLEKIDIKKNATIIKNYGSQLSFSDIKKVIDYKSKNTGFYERYWQIKKREVNLC